MNVYIEDYGACKSDKEITRMSGYLNVLPENSNVYDQLQLKQKKNIFNEKHNWEN
jgi:hypothetical protein